MGLDVGMATGVGQAIVLSQLPYAGPPPDEIARTLADLLRMSEDALRIRIEEGATLDALAAETNADRREIMRRMAELARERAQAARDLRELDEQEAQRQRQHARAQIASGAGESQPGRIAGVLGDFLNPGQVRMLERLGRRLNIPPDELRSELRSGRTLDDILAEGGLLREHLAGPMILGFLLDRSL